MAGDVGLEGRFAAEEDERELEQKRGMFAHEQQQGVDESIGVPSDQGSIEIDAERPQGCWWRVRLRKNLRQSVLPRC